MHQRDINARTSTSIPAAVKSGSFLSLYIQQWGPHPALLNPPALIFKLSNCILSSALFLIITTGNKHAIGRRMRAYNKRLSSHFVRRWHSGVREVGLGGHIGGSIMPLGGRMHTQERGLTSWELTAGKRGEEGGVYLPRTPYLVRGEWTKDFTGL